MDRFYGGSVDLYGGKSKKEKDMKRDTDREMRR